MGSEGKHTASQPPAAMYEAMYLIRRVEERLIDEYGSRRLRMALHLSIGQEAVAVGVLGAARPTDTVVGTHRSHAFYLAKGGGLQEMIDEFYSLPTGCSHGVGGSMHLSAPEVGLLGSTAVLGGGVPIAVGGGFAHRRAGKGDVSFAFTGDGGVDEGSFWEALNLAALLRLPVLFVVENNGYSTLTPQNHRQASVDLAAKSAAFGVEAVSVDGNDAIEVDRVAAELIGRLRSGAGPLLVEARTFRYVAHVGVVSDWGTGRPVSEREGWPDCDPLVRLERAVVVADADLATVRSRVEAAVDGAFAAAIAAFEANNAVERLEAPAAAERVEGLMGGESSLTFAEAMQAAMAQEMLRDPSVFAYGEGINDPGGFFGTTVGLRDRFGQDRCLDVPNCEETLAGFGLGAALGGLRPVFVNLRIEFLLLATNQLVNHVAKWGSMQGRDVAVPLTIRAMVGRGWGQGAQHSGSYAAMLAHVPGLQVAVPSGPLEGAGLLVSAVRGNRPTVLIEPKAVYETVDLVPAAIDPVPIGRAFVRREGAHFTVVALGDAVHLALAVAERLQETHGIEVEVIDLCSLAPFDAATIRASVARTGRVGVIDIGWESFGVASEVARCLVAEDPVRLAGPMLSWAPAGHAPAGCFAEARHYPTEDRVAAGIAASLPPPPPVSST